MANGIVLQLELPVQQYEQLTQMAQRRQQQIAEVAELAMTEWLARQLRLEQARARMRELGQGLGKGKRLPLPAIMMRCSIKKTLNERDFYRHLGVVCTG